MRILSAIAVLAAAGFVWISQSEPAVSREYRWEPGTGAFPHGYILEEEIRYLANDSLVVVVDTLISENFDHPEDTTLPRSTRPWIPGAEVRVRVAGFRYAWIESIPPGGGEPTYIFLDSLRVGPFSLWASVLHDDGPPPSPSQPLVEVTTE